MRYLLAVLVCVLLIGGRLQAQVAVFDPANLIQTVLTATRTLNEYRVLVEQYRVIVEMATKMSGDLSRYRTPPFTASRHDAARYQYGGPLLEALNSGDARGAIFERVLGTLPELGPAVSQLPADARRAVTGQQAALEIANSILQRAIHQRALVGGFSGELNAAIQALENDITNPRTAYHYLTARLDLLTAGELIARRQQTAENQVTSHTLELLLDQSRRKRDTEVVVMRMRLNALQYGEGQNGLVAGAAADLQTWRQP
jgi:hypothetical protein